MTAEDDAALEAEQQVLPDRVHGVESATVEDARDAGRQSTRVRAPGFDALSDEDPKARGGAMDRVAFGHAVSVPDARLLAYASPRGAAARRRRRRREPRWYSLHVRSAPADHLATACRAGDPVRSRSRRHEAARGAPVSRSPRRRPGARADARARSWTRRSPRRADRPPCS